MTILGQGGPGIDEVQDEGTALPFAHALNFAGAGVAVTLDAPNDRFLVTIPAGGVTDHGALTGLADDDHPQYGALAQAETWDLLQTFSSGLQLAAAQAIKDSGGTDRIVPKTTTPHLTTTGDIQVNSGQISIGEAPSGNRGLNVAPALGTVTTNAEVLRVQPGTTTLNANNLSYIAVSGLPQVSLATGKTGLTIMALNFSLAVTAGGGTAVITKAANIEAATLFSVANCTVTGLYGLRLPTPLFVVPGASMAVTTSYGIEIGNVGPSNKIVDAYALYIANITTNTGFRRLIEALGATGTNLRLEAGDPTNPGALKGRSQLLLDFNENGVIALRRVEWVDSGVAGAGLPANSKVLVGI